MSIATTPDEPVFGDDIGPGEIPAEFKEEA